jgi:hypothetical protein
MKFILSAAASQAMSLAIGCKPKANSILQLLQKQRDFQFKMRFNMIGATVDPILDGMKHIKGGLNIFGRLRITHLEKSDCPEALLSSIFGAGTHRHAHLRGT